MDLFLLIGFPMITAVGFLVWKFRYDRGVIKKSQTLIRRREDARDWQRRFGAESLLAANFFPPTQNEVLETLYILDHLTPEWETGDANSIERSFLNELALNFPMLRKANSVFPLGLNENHEGAKIADRREAFRARRAQFNALDQIISAPAPSDAPDRPPSNRSESMPVRPVRNAWPMVLGSAAILVATVLFVARYVPGAVNFKTVAQQAVEPSTNATPFVDEAAPVPTPAVAVVVAESTPTPPPTPAHKVAEVVPLPSPRATPSQETLALERQIAASKQRAVDKYPALAVEGSEINLRFVFRYKNLVQQKSPRLLDPSWPEQLVDECATAAGITPKRDVFTRVLGTPR